MTRQAYISYPAFTGSTWLRVTVDRRCLRCGSEDVRMAAPCDKQLYATMFDAQEWDFDNLGQWLCNTCRGTKISVSYETQPMEDHAPPASENINRNTPASNVRSTHLLQRNKRKEND